MELYRYETPYYSYLSENKLDLRKFHVVKETPKGYWYVRDYYRNFGEIHINENTKKRWVSKNGLRRYCYPTKEEALKSFQYRKRSEIAHLEGRLEKAKKALYTANEKSDIEIKAYSDNDFKLDGSVLKKWQEREAFIKEDEMNL